MTIGDKLAEAYRVTKADRPSPHLERALRRTVTGVADTGLHEVPAPSLVVDNAAAA